jgi:transcriptional regulator with XRE-family HTH domain
MARCGLTGEQIAAELGVSRSTLNLWAKLHAELSDALKEGRAHADALVEDSLYQRATGYDYNNTEVRQVTTEEERPADKDDDSRAARLGGTQKVSRTVRTVKTIKYHCPPDVVACIFWLKNRQPARWRDRPAEVSDGKATVRARRVTRPQQADGKAAGGGGDA